MAKQAPPTPGTAKMELKVYCKTEVDDVGMDTLIGEYNELGSNHGRKTFKRKVPSDDGDVYLYYWDARDGADQSGWWFGDSVGGTQVWARCQNSSALPPSSGWMVPWDGEVVNALVIEQKGKAVAKGKPAPKSTANPKAPAKSPPPSPMVEIEDDVVETNGTPGAADEQVKKATAKVAAVESEAVQAMAEAKAMVANDNNEENVKIAEELLQKNQQQLMDAQKAMSVEAIEVRKKDPKATADMSKLTNKLRGVTMRVNQELANIKKAFAEKIKALDDVKKKAKFEEMQLQAEQRDAQILEEALPAAMDLVTQAEEALEVVVSAAAPLNNGLDEHMVEEANRAIKDTEAAVVKAQTSVGNAKKELTVKMAAAAKFAPEAQKVAIAEFSSLVTKMDEIQARLNDFKSVKKDWDQKHESKRIMTEVASKLGDAEVEVDKVVGSFSEDKKYTEEEIKKIESSVPPALNALLTAAKFVDTKAATATGALKRDLGQMQERGRESKAKMEAFKVKLRIAADRGQLDALLQQCIEKVKAAEEAVEEMNNAEGPIIKGGIEALAEEEASEAIKACEEAAKKAEMVANTAKAFLKTKGTEVKKFSEASRKSTVEEMEKLQGRVDYAAQKITDFKKENSSRKTAVMLKDITVATIDAENKLQAVTEAAKPLHVDNLENVPLETLKEATEKTLECEKAASLMCAEVRKVFAAKTKESPAKDAESYKAELQKLNTRVSTLQAELAKERKVALTGEKLYKVRQTVDEKQKEMEQIEAELEKVEIMTTPVGDERPSDENVKEMDAAVTAVQQSLTDCKKACETAVTSAQGVHKEALDKLLAKTTEAQKQLDEIKATTRELVERLQCDHILAEAQKKLDKVEEAFEKTEEAEGPYLKGLDVLPTDEAIKAVADSEAAATVVQQALNDARTFLSSKSLDVRRFVEEISKAGLAKIKELTGLHEEATKRLAEFKKETESRKRVAHLQEGAAKVDAADEAVKIVTEAAAPLATQNADEASSEAAQEICEKLGAVEKTAQEKMDEARRFLTERQREMKSAEDRAEISKHLTRLNSIQVDLAKARSAAANAEQKFVAKMLMAEVNEVMQGLEAQVEEVTEEASPLTEEGGRDFLVASMSKMLIDALSEHANQSGTSKEELYKQMNGGASDTKVSEAEFVKFFEKIPELCTRPDLAFSAEQLGAVFEQIDEDDDGALSQEDFLDMFKERFVCVAGVSVTDVFDLQSDECNTTSKLEVGDIVESLGKPRIHESLGITRMNVKTLKSGGTGWITLQGNQGTTFIEPFTAFVAFMRGIEKMLAEAQANASKASAFITQKTVELKDCKSGPLADTKETLTKLRPKVSVLEAKLSQLKKKVQESAAEHAKREEFEKRKAAEKEDRKAVAVVLKAIGDKVEKAQAALSKFVEAAKPLVSDSPPNLESMTTPLTCQKESKNASAAVEAEVSVARDSLKAQEERLASATKGPWSEAKQDMTKLQEQVSEIETKAAAIITGMQSACDEIGKAKHGQVCTALRAAMQSESKTIESLFTELAGKDGDHVPEEKLMKLDCVAKLAFSPEQKQLLWARTCASAAGINRRSFFQMLERFCKCVKEIAVTSEFDLGAGDIVRKLQLGEFVEVLEGPRLDEDDQVPRVRAKAVTDGIEGWITMKGNQGSAYLIETLKPCLYATEAVAMQDGFATEGTKELRALKPLEVIEVLEGPKKEVVGTAVRAKGKTSDGVEGWFTIKSKQGSELAQPGKSTWSTTSAIALTDNVDIKACKVVRKLAKGEMLIVAEAPLVDEVSGVVRIKVVAKKDGKEGWVTTKGNAGTKYAEQTGQSYTISKATPLQASFQSDSDTLKMLAEQESVDVIEGPTEETVEPSSRVRGRCLNDGTIGWVTMKASNLKPWKPQYRCVQGTGIGDALEVSNAEPIRKLQLGETLEVIDGPKVDAEVGVVRVKGRATSDGAVGWVTLAGNQGTQFLEVSSD